MDISYEDAIRTIQREHRVDEPTAALMVAEIYPSLGDGEERDSARFDDPDELGVPFVYHAPVAEGRVVQVDADRSPAGEVAALEARIGAQQDGDHYRRLSRHIGGHYHT